MNWLNAKRTRMAVKANTVAELIDILKTCPQDWPIRNADNGRFCGITISTDGTDKEVALY